MHDPVAIAQRLHTLGLDFGGIGRALDDLPFERRSERKTQLWLLCLSVQRSAHGQCRTKNDECPHTDHGLSFYLTNRTARAKQSCPTTMPACTTLTVERG